jgi:glycosyltransferase involved in cell wall biosynthesis
MILKTNAILPISRGTGQKLEQFYQLKFTAIVNPPLKPQIFFREGIDSFLKAHFLKFKQYIVVVGTLEPRKNFQQLISVYLQSIEIYGLDRILPLVMIGGGGWKNEKLREMLTGTQQRYPSHFFVQGYITDDELAFFLSGARYYLMLSKYEGYGMPLAEARTCRTAVICLDQIEMKEAAEDDGIFLNSDEWEKEIVPYLLIDSEVQYPRKVLYESNQEKALRISEIIDQL